MGAVNFSIDYNLVRSLKDALGLRIFVETGSFEGDTLASIVGLFDQVYSVESSEDYFHRCQKRFKSAPHVKLTHGHSPVFLQQLHDKIQGQSVLYWLDAHWCMAENTAGEESQCPLLDELKAIRQLNSDSIIMIDDARLFLCTPCAPHNITQWPEFQDILDQLRSLSATHRLMVLNDVIFFYPPFVASLLNQYAYDHGTDWLHQVNLAKQADHASSDAQVKGYLEAQGLDPANASDILWKQLVEKEAVIQSLIAQLKEAERRTVDEEQS